MKSIFKKTQEINRANLYPQPTLKVRIRDIKIVSCVSLIWIAVIFILLITM